MLPSILHARRLIRWTDRFEKSWKIKIKKFLLLVKFDAIVCAFHNKQLPREANYLHRLHILYCKHLCKRLKLCVGTLLSVLHTWASSKHNDIENKSLILDEVFV